jgi:predicted HicB family RNase H-like nuclease
MLDHKGYFGTVEADDGVFVGRVAGLRDVITFEGGLSPKSKRPSATASATTSPFARSGVRRRTALTAAKSRCASDRRCTGRAAMRAQAAGMSLNQWIAQRIETGT